MSLKCEQCGNECKAWRNKKPTRYCSARCRGLADRKTNAWRQVGNVIEIELTQGQKTIIDADDKDLILKYRWNANWSKDTKTFYALRTRRSDDPPGLSTQLSRLIMNAPPRLLVDHINHDTLDNRKTNLRLCTRAKNNRNRRQRNSNKKTSRYKGVHTNKTKPGKWFAALRYNKTTIHLGGFDSEIQAARAYNKAAKQYFGEFASLNEIVENEQ